jgi:hypothetical protein
MKKKKNVKHYIEKIPLKKIIKHEKIADLLREYVNDVSKIITESLFLLNTYTLHCLDSGVNVNLDGTLIRQCVSLTINNGNVKLGKVKEKYKKNDLNSEKIKMRELRLETLSYVYKEIFNKEAKVEFKKIDYVTSAVEYFVKTYSANIMNHVTLNFNKFQFNYLKLIVAKRLHQINLSKKQINTITSNIQNTLLEQSEINIRSKIFDDNLLENIKETLKTIQEEEFKNLPSSLIDSEYIKKYHSLPIKKNLNDTLRYFHKMLRYIEIHRDDFNKKRKEDGESSIKINKFSLLPHIAPKHLHITLDRRSLCVIYNSFYVTKQVGIVDFQKNYMKYYDELFKTKAVLKRTYSKWGKPKFFSTDGYSASILFQKGKSGKTNKDTKEENGRAQCAHSLTLDNALHCYKELYLIHIKQCIALSSVCECAQCARRYCLSSRNEKSFKWIVRG